MNTGRVRLNEPPASGWPVRAVAQTTYCATGCGFELRPVRTSSRGPGALFRFPVAARRCIALGPAFFERSLE